MVDVSDKPVVIIAVAVIAILVIGEVIVYTSDSSDYGAGMHAEDGVIHYDLESRGSKVFDLVVSDNGGYTGVEKLYLYLDPGYASKYGVDEADVGATSNDQRYHLEQLEALLDYRGVTDVSFVDAAQLGSLMSGGISSGDCTGTGVVVVSGALPDTVYTGRDGDTVLQWIGLGGTLYWAGGLLGAYYATPDAVHPVEGYQELFLGSQCLNTGDVSRAYSEVSSNGYRSALSLSNNDVRYAVSQSMLPAGTASLAIGYEEAGYQSIVLVGHGSGSVAVFGGPLSSFQRYDMAQVIASGIGPSSVIVDHIHGTVSGTASGTAKAGDVAYVYLGGYYPVYGKSFWF